MSGGKFAATAKKQAGKNKSRYSNVASLKRPHIDESGKWRFGFGNFKEIEFFGLKGAEVPNNWMVSLLTRLASMEGADIRGYVTDPVMAQQNRLHPIDWGKKNVPVKFSDLDWLPERYKNNQQEFPIYQFQVSTGRGRVVGFFDEVWTFQIVLLDPLHNIQPSKDYDFQVNHCGPLGSDFHALEKKVDQIVSAAPKCDCGVALEIKKALPSRVNGKTLVLCLHCDKTIENVMAVIELAESEGMADVSVAKVFAAGAEEILKQLSSK